MAKKTAKKTVKKTVKKPALITVGDVPVAPYVNDAPVSASSEKPAKPPIGTPGNPRKISSYNMEYINGDIPDGVSETFFIEVMYEPQGKRKPKWEMYGYESHSTAKAALRAMKEIRASEVESIRYSLEEDWRRENARNQKTADLIQFKVTKSTTKKAIEEHVAYIESMQEQLKNNPPVEMPDFSKVDPEYPKFRVSRRTFSADTEVVGEPVEIKKGKGK